ncbi:MAG: sel1 repeat family protein [Verrucomicrobiae bacterium]|nr:sel1 repeat family protein [Verrucomicrobiae bacterium]
MSQIPNAEFAQFRFLRDAAGNVVNLPTQRSDERVLLVLDCERWGFARLHIFEEAAVRGGKLEAFEEEMMRVAELRCERVSRLYSWGRDAEELFYADEMRDGEPLPDYLGRAGKVPVPVASSWMLRTMDLLEAVDPLPSSMERLTTLNFEVVSDRRGVVWPVFSEFTGWTRPGAQVREHRLEWSLAQIFCSLIAGVPIRTFHNESLPRNFDELPGEVRKVVLAVFSEDGRDLWPDFRAAMHAGVESASGAGEPESPPLPRRPFREWLVNELAKAKDREMEGNLSDGWEAGAEPYAWQARIRGVLSQVQVLPGNGSIPREGWLNQHHDVTRRPGRGRLHQVQVNYLEDLESLTLIGEEQIEGVDLGEFIERTGPLDPAAVAEFALRVDSALEALEDRTGACSVWWLPPRNVLLVTGTRSLDASLAFADRKGEEFWNEVPLKFRLHQTSDSLMNGVELPAKVRDCLRLPGRKFHDARRSAVAIPLLWHLLTGTRFRWDLLSEQSRLLDSLASRFETFRVRMNEDPETVEENFFREFARWVRDPSTLTQAADSTDVEEVVGGNEESESARLVEEPSPMSFPLYEGEIELPKGDEGGLSGVGASGETDAADLTEDGVENRRKVPWMTLTLAAVVLSAITGFLLSGWSEHLGFFRSSEPPVFELPDFRVDHSRSLENAREALADYLVGEGSPQSLRLLPLLNRIDAETARRELEPWLRHLAAKGEAGAMRVMGLLTMALGQSADVAEGWFLEGARKGDPDSCYHLALLRWDREKGQAPGEEENDFLKEAAKSGHAPSRELYARRLILRGEKEDAIENLARAADEGWVPAIYQLGVARASGLGCKRDPVEAADLFRRAAEQGDERAMFDYGRCLSEGYGVTASFPEALRWIKQASAHGHGAALRWLLDRGIDQ